MSDTVLEAPAAPPVLETSSASDATLKTCIARAALDAGAAAVAFAPADPDEQTRRRMQAAFARGDLATWGYDAAYAVTAADPRKLLPQARSIVCVALAYAHQAPAGRVPLTGRVSNYAWSADYHRRLRELLSHVARRIEELSGGAETRIVCDTLPLAERAFAARAGLGWIGKHTNLIVPGAGSYVFLGEILTTLRLEPDPPSKKSCGTCRRCVAACPTGALRGDYTIDATRCISDLTQRTDAIPRNLRSLLGEWVWGCDLCQAVCPPTRRAVVHADPAFAPPAAAAAFPDLLALLQLRSRQFKRRYRGTPMGWRGGAVLRRNAAVALGNSLDRAAVPALREALRRDPHPLVRGHAAWALGRIGSPQARAALNESFRQERDASVREEVDAALSTLEPRVPKETLSAEEIPSR